MILSVAKDVVFIGTAMIILASIYGVVGLLFSAIIADILTFILTIWFTLEFYHKAKERNAYSTSLESIGDGKTIINNHIVITISREYGSGGRYVSQLLAKKLGINFYDKELIKLIAKDTGFTENYIENNIESSTSLNSFYNNDDKMFASETRIIKNLAKKESCVIVGRWADDILRDNKSTYKVFIFNSMKEKIKRAVKYYGLKEDNAEKEIDKINKRRAKHYKHYTNRNWNDYNNYDMVINADKLGIENTVNVIENIIVKMDK